MNQLLDFIGGLLFLFVMVMITPLLVAVYGAIGVIMVLHYIGRHKLGLPFIFMRLKRPRISFQLKRQFLFSKS